MSMLAEPRRKKKWSVDPQGKRWSTDNEKIGQKMLEKMGWTNGKGLGINEQGMKEHVRINKRNPENEKAGIGYDKDSYTKDLDGYQDKFNKILQQLAKYHNQEEIGEKPDINQKDQSKHSLELKSKQSRARLHYQKFIRSKDVSKYSSKDLASILGKKELSSKAVMTEDNSTYENEVIGTKDNWGGVVTINSGSMADYFKQKLPNNIMDNQAADSESETEQSFGFGFISKNGNISTNAISKNTGEKSNYAFDNPFLRFDSPTETTVNTEYSFKKSKKKRRKECVLDVDLYTDEMNKVNNGKRSKIGIIDSNCKDGFTNLALNLDTKLNKEYNGKEFEVSRAQFGLENCGLDLTDEKSNKKRVTFNDHVEYSIDATKKKKEKATLDKFEVENKKLKKKRKFDSANTLSDGFVNEALEVEMVAEINDNELNEHKSTKSKKRKICKTSSLETIQESPEREKEIIEINLEDDTLDTSPAGDMEIDIAIIKSEKKKKKKQEGKIMDNSIANVESGEIDTINEKIIKNKKLKLDNKKRKGTCETHSKKRKKSEGLETVINGISDKNKKSRKQKIIIEDSAEVEVSPVVTTITKKSMQLGKENSVQKKKKRDLDNYNKNNCLENEFNTCDADKEISDKENAIEEQESNIKLPKKNKRKRSKDALDTENSTNLNTEVIDANIINNQESVNNVEFIDTPSKKTQVIDSHTISSPWNKKAKMTKKILKKFFHKNQIADFPGSNLEQIKGYGVDFNGD